MLEGMVSCEIWDSTGRKYRQGIGLSSLEEEPSTQQRQGIQKIRPMIRRSRSIAGLVPYAAGEVSGNVGCGPKRLLSAPDPILSLALSQM